MNKQVLLSARELWTWAKGQEFRGHDPHDLLESPLLRWLPVPAFRLIALQLGRRSPIDLRKTLLVPKSINPKGLALFLSGLISARDQVLADWLSEAEALATTLASLQDEPTGGWGYPFAWQSRTHYVPKAKPNIVTTAFCGMALLELHHIRKEPRWKSSIARAVDYVCDRIPHRHFPEGSAFGYAEDDPQIVYNAALLGAEFLVRASAVIDRPSLLETARSVARFVLSKQREDGSWQYGMEPTQTWIDSFHTGFVIDSLHAIGRALQDREMLDGAERGFAYFIKTFVKTDGSIAYFSNKTYPIDAHAVGQAISMMARHDHVAAAEHTALYAIENLHSPQGFFYYQRTADRVNRIPYMRWSNAWMFKGLCDLIRAER